MLCCEEINLCLCMKRHHYVWMSMDDVDDRMWMSMDEVMSFAFFRCSSHFFFVCSFVCLFVCFFSYAPLSVRLVQCALRGGQQWREVC